MHTVVYPAYAAIGPVADVHVVNRIIAPDGFNRSYVFLNPSFVREFTCGSRTVLAGDVLHGGTFPGPLITGFKVCFLPLPSEF